MRVKIGKYPNRLMCNWHSNHMEKKYGFNWPAKRSWTRSDRAFEKIDDWVQSVYHVFNWLYFDRRKQTVKVKIDPWDTWSMDTTLGLIILPMLEQLKATKHGGPFVDPEDVPEHLRPTEKELEQAKKDGSTDEHFFDRWDWVMDEMIFAFESQTSDWEDQFTSGKMDMLTVPIDTAGNEVDELDATMYRWDRGPNDTYEIDFDGMKEYQARISNGFRLFGKYFNSLWD